jgi:hypothetical protein
MKIGGTDIVAMLVATSFAAGLNVYATLATLGLLARAEVVHLPPALHLVQDWWVIGASAALFILEFFADKIPVFDLIWNALHTFIRIPIAALLAYGATANSSPHTQMIATVAGGLIATVAHTGKTAARVGVTPSPEPFTNFALSTSEDIGAIGLTWIATTHPYIAAGIALACVVLLIVLIRWIVRSIRSGVALLKRKFFPSEASPRAA